MDLKIIFNTHVSFEEMLIHYIGVHNVFNVKTCGLHFKVIWYKCIAISHPVVSLLSCLRKQGWISRFLNIPILNIFF